MSEKLKPCPFCGSNDIAFDFGLGRGVAYAYCCNCGAETITRASASEAANDWNRRAIDVDALREVADELECAYRSDDYASVDALCELSNDASKALAKRIRKAVGL